MNSLGWLDPKTGSTEHAPDIMVWVWYTMWERAIHNGGDDIGSETRYRWQEICHHAQRYPHLHDGA